MKRKHEEEEHENAERWLISYADFITLLMVFFVIMYSMSKVDQQKFYQLAQSLNSAFVGGTGTLTTGDKNTGEIDPNLSPEEAAKLAEELSALTPEELAVKQQELIDEMSQQLAGQEAAKEAQEAELKDMGILSEKLSKYFIEKGIVDEVTLNIDDRGLVISLNATALFDSGSAEIKEEMTHILIPAGEIIDTLDNYIRVEGHTDNVPVGNSKYESNLELSAARATNVVELFIHEVGIKPQKLVMAGYSEYKPIASNDTPEGRSKNRRVDIIVLSNKYNSLEDEHPIDVLEGKTPEEIEAEETTESPTQSPTESDEEITK